MSPISFGCGIAASCAVVSATRIFGSASPFFAAVTTTYSFRSFTPSSPRSSVKSWIVVKSGVQSESVRPQRYRAGA